MNFIFQQINNDKLLETLNQNDIIYLKNANIKLPIHKIIAFKSNFIKSMIKSDFQKTNEVILEITDENLIELKNYFYFEKIQIGLNNFSDLYEVSQYLILEDLQKRVEDFLKNIKLKLKNFEGLYKFSQRYYHIIDIDLQEKLHNYLNENIKSYLLSDLLTNLDVLYENLEKFSFIEILKILNNVLSLENLNPDIKKLKDIIIKNEWKFLSKNDFWNDFLIVLDKLGIDINSLPNLQSNLDFINSFNGKIKNYDELNNYNLLLDLKENDYIDILDEKNRWYLAKINKKISNFLKISYRGWSDKYNETIDLIKDVSRVSLPYSKSIKFTELPINSYVEFKGNNWEVYKIIESTENFIGLKHLNKNTLVKANPNSLYLAEHPTHVRKLTYYYNSSITISDVNWDLIPEDCLVNEDLNQI